jgi:hypothetical protein
MQGSRGQVRYLALPDQQLKLSLTLNDPLFRLGCIEGWNTQAYKAMCIKKEVTLSLEGLFYCCETTIGVLYVLHI